MSALEGLWLWLQGRSSRTEAGPDTTDAIRTVTRQGPSQVKPENAEESARIQRHWRYRAGPWQMK